MGGVVMPTLGKANLALVQERAAKEDCVGSQYPQSPAFTGEARNPQGASAVHSLWQIQERD